MAVASHRQHLKPDELADRDIPSTSYSPSSSNSNKKKWSNFLPILVGLVVIGEIAFLGRLDAVKNSDLVNSWADSFYHFTQASSYSYWSTEDSTGSGQDQDRVSEPAPGQSCESWLEENDSVPYSRDFEKDPILVHGPDEEWKTCGVGCKFVFDSGKKYDAAFGLSHESGTASVIRSMESATYYAENNIANARRRGYDVVMTTSLSSDVPVGYFSWSEYDIMAPVEPKTENAIAAAFISNCGARNFRLQALIGLEKANIKIDSYGGCHRNRDGNVDKVKTLKKYKFSLAFENSNEEDYVTEKFFQSLVAGNVPVFIGASNIQDFAPAPGSILHIKEVKDVDDVAKTMKYLAENSSAYNETLRSDNLTLEALSSAVLLKFKSLKHVPIWKSERPESIRGGNELKVYKIYPVGMTQRQALYTFRFNGDSEFRNHLESHPCAKFEVVFV
ncbi:glycoprotein 3-alpha-l-fucosyltransferase a [Phtheirospermum japonicum]|uniref:Fucosyltransferase n=1 Tax=Phtheirospermum japonicum TaxID=374723 RepID=A0A830BL06_9LAMI|nr:glycoprotein 3-alpha-l-fucosyltransferase a [Phtheirospermum japonicum]